MTLYVTRVPVSRTGAWIASRGWSIEPLASSSRDRIDSAQDAPCVRVSGKKYSQEFGSTVAVDDHELLVMSEYPQREEGWLYEANLEATTVYINGHPEAEQMKQVSPYQGRNGHGSEVARHAHSGPEAGHRSRLTRLGAAATTGDLHTIKAAWG
ncbi:hypothetical protein SCUP515_02697 [Seiridium cupressi]